MIDRPLTSAHINWDTVPTVIAGDLIAIADRPALVLSGLWTFGSVNSTATLDVLLDDGRGQVQVAIDRRELRIADGYLCRWNPGTQRDRSGWYDILARGGFSIVSRLEDAVG